MNDTPGLAIIERLDQFFSHYTPADIDALRSQDADFGCMWERYVAGLEGEEALTAWWTLWLVRFTDETRHRLIDYALTQYGYQKQETLLGS